MNNYTSINGACDSVPGFGYGFTPYQYYHPYVYDRLWINNNWNRPMNVIYHIYGEKEKTFESKRLRKSYGEYIIKERNGRDVVIGKLKLKDKFIVNQCPDGTFDAFCCVVESEGNEPKLIVVPYKNFVKRDILQYLPFFRRNEDCPDRYIVSAFFHEIVEGDDIKFLQLPWHSGWQDKKDNKTTFASADVVIPQLRMYYPNDILERKLIHTKKQFADAAKPLNDLLAAHWKYKFLLAIRLTSLFLYFYELADLKPDQIFVVEPKDESNAKVAVAILKNRNFDTNTCPLTSSKTGILQELNSINDGIALFRDSSYVEDRKKRDASLNVLLQDLHSCTGNEFRSRHITAIVSDNPGTISSEFPAYFISLNDCPYINNVNELQKAIGEFEYALIQLLTNSDITENLITNELNKTVFLRKNMSNSEYYMSMKMLRATIGILYDYKVISPDENKKIIDYLKKFKNELPDTDQAIVNEFRQITSDMICQNSIRVANQMDSPYFDPQKPMVIFDGKYINVRASTLDRTILRFMKTTQRRNKLLSALKACGKLYSNNNYKRNIDVEVSPGVTHTISVYSFPKDILTSECIRKINTVAFDSYLLTKKEFPHGFVPLVRIDGCDKSAGCVINEMTDEAESIYVSGKTRSGKTRFLVEQALIRAASGNKVVIFDQTGAFSLEELKKHLTDEAVESMFSHWDIGKFGIPIDLLSLDNCSSLPEKKNRLFSIFSVAARATGDVQCKVLRKCLSSISRDIDAGKIHFLHEALKCFDKNDSEQARLKERLEDVFSDLEGLNVYERNWEEFLVSQNKIVVLSASADGIRKSSQLIDMMLASLYEYKQHDKDPKHLIILDEIEDLCLEKDGPISTILRKGAKHHLSMLLASQEYSIEKDKLGKLIGNCGSQVFFHPKDGNISDIAKFIGVERSILANLELGQCVVHGLMYDKSKDKNMHTTVVGRTYQHNK